jgi:suppressor for copper-sensitivity B
MKKLLTIFFFLMILSTSSWGQDMARADHVAGKILSETTGVGTKNKIDMGLSIDLDDGWYTYWRVAGDSGLPPVIDWSASKNVKDVVIHWPVPKRFVTQGLHSFGYDDAFIFPLEVTLEKSSAPVTLALKVDLVICHEICIPATLSLSKTLEAKGARAAEDFALLKAAREKLPSTMNTDRLGIGTAVLGKDAIVITANARDGFGPGTDVFIESKDVLVTGAPEILSDSAQSRNAVLKIKAPDGVDYATELFGKTGTIVLTDGKNAVERSFAF